MGKINWMKSAYALILLCATTAIALPPQSFTALQSGSITPVVPNETIALPAQTFRTLHSFDETDGSYPHAGLLQATDGNLYGTTSHGGANEECSMGYGCGTLFRISPSGKLTTLYSFCSQPGCADGYLPVGVLVQGTDGNFYGTTSAGGIPLNPNWYYGSAGTVFKITPGGTLTTLYRFCSQSGCYDGAGPSGGLVHATDGNFYGTTSSGGPQEVNGTFFKITPGGTLTTLYRFCSQSGCTDGESPEAGLVQATDGNLYGTTGGGGANGYGTVFKVTPSGTLTTLYSFCSQSDCTDGAMPSAGLVQGTDGNLYGTTVLGGPEGCRYGYSYEDGCGTVFKITPGGTLTTLYSFCSQGSSSHPCTDGAYAYAGLVQATDGNLYGTTYYGGACCGLGAGTVFKITPAGTFYSFCSQSPCGDGFAQPVAGLVQDTNGNFYGTTSVGGVGFWSVGTVFSLSVGLGPFVETQPTSGSMGEAVKILGTGLTGAIRVMFNGHGAVFTVVSSSLITTTVPAGATTGAVEVVTPTGTLFSNVPFRVPSSFSPLSPGGEGDSR